MEHLFQLLHLDPSSCHQSPSAPLCGGKMAGRGPSCSAHTGHETATCPTIADTAPTIVDTRPSIADITPSNRPNCPRWLETVSTLPRIRVPVRSDSARPVAP